jgi:hypothetical protein
MKKIFVLATTAMLLLGASAYANGDAKAKKNKKKATTEKVCPRGECPKECPKTCPPVCLPGKCS